MVKKRFGIDQVTNQALSQTMQMAKQNDSNFNNTIIQLGKIHLDLENPRKHKIKYEDLKNGPGNDDPDYMIKMQEYKGLQQLSFSINKDGLLHPIIVYKDGNDYKLVAGERRFFASIIAGKTQIEARVFKSRPKSFDLKIIQWTENESRKNLPLDKRLLNIAAIIEGYDKMKNQKLTDKALGNLLSISRPLAQCYKAILSNQPLLKMIKGGRVQTLRVARDLASCTGEKELQKALELLSQNRALPKKVENVGAKQKVAQKRAGRKRQTISLGTTQKSAVVKVLVDGVLSSDRFSRYSQQFKASDWSSLDQATNSFQKLIKILEKELEITT